MSPAIRWHTRAPCATLVLLIAVLVGASLRMRCVLADREDKVAIEPKRMMLLKKVQRKLIQLPREELWNILARQQRHLNSVRQELDKKLTTESITSLRQKLAGAEENVLAFRLLCGLEDSVGLDDEKLIAKYYTNAIAATKTSDERAECQEREAKLDALMAKWSGLQDELQREVGELVQQRKDVKILQEAYERSKAYHQRMLDIVFLKDGPEKVKDLDALHQSRRYVHAGGENVLPVGEYQDLSDGMYVYPIYLLRDVCWDGNGTEPSEVETQSLCPPEILDMIRQLRDLQWEYYHISFLLHLLQLTSAELSSLLLLITNRYEVTLDENPYVGSSVLDPPVDTFQDNPGTYAPRPADVHKSFSFLLYCIHYTKNLPSGPDSVQHEKEVVKRKNLLKVKILKQQVSLGLLYSETLLDPRTGARELQIKLADLYSSLSLLRFHGRITLPDILISDFQHVIKREFVVSVMEYTAHKFNVGGATRDFELQTEPEENRALLATIEEAYIVRLQFFECFRSHNLKRFMDSRAIVLSSAHQVIKDRCIHHAENIIQIEKLIVDLIGAKLQQETNTNWTKILLAAEQQKVFHRTMISIMSHFSKQTKEDVYEHGTDEITLLFRWLDKVIEETNALATDLGITLTKPKMLEMHASQTQKDVQRELHVSIRNIRSRVHTLRHEVDVLRKQHPVQAMLHAESEWYQLYALKELLHQQKQTASGEAPLDAIEALDKKVDLHLNACRAQLLKILVQPEDLPKVNSACQNEISNIILKEDLLPSPTEPTTSVYNYFLHGLKVTAMEIEDALVNLTRKDRAHSLRTALLKMETIEILQQMEHSWLSLSRNVLDKNVYERLEKYNPMMDAVETVCERGYSKDKNFDIKDAVKSCPGEVIDRLKTLRALEYKLERLRFMVDYFSVKGDVRNDIFSVLFRRMSTSLRVSSAAQTGFTTSMTKVVSQMNETYRVAMSKESESERMSALYACIQSDTLTDLVHFEDADGFFASTSNSVYLDYRIILFDMELIRGLFVGVEDLARDQYLRALLDVERQVTLHRHLLGLRSAPVLLTSGMLSKFHLNIQRMTSLHRLFVDVQALSANRPGISALQELVERSSTYNMDPRGDIQKELEKLSVTTQAAASGTPAAPLPAYVVSGVEPAAYARLLHLSRESYGLLEKCLNEQNANQISNACFPPLHDYMEVHMWFMDMFESVPRIPSALRLGLYALDRSVHLSDLIKKELVIRLKLPNADMRQQFTYECIHTDATYYTDLNDALHLSLSNRLQMSTIQLEVEGELHSLMSVIRALAKTVEDTAQTHTYQDDLTGASAQTLSDIGVPSGSPAEAAASAAKRKAAMDARERLRQGILKELDQMQQDMNDAAKGKPKNKEVNMFDIPELVLLAKKRGVVLSGASKNNRTQKTEGWVVAVAVLCPLAFVALMGSILLLWHQSRRNQTVTASFLSHEELLRTNHQL